MEVRYRNARRRKKWWQTDEKGARAPWYAVFFVISFLGTYFLMEFSAKIAALSALTHLVLIRFLD